MRFISVGQRKDAGNSWQCARQRAGRGREQLVSIVHKQAACWAWRAAARQHRAEANSVLGVLGSSSPASYIGISRSSGEMTEERDTLMPESMSRYTPPYAYSAQYLWFEVRTKGEAGCQPTHPPPWNYRHAAVTAANLEGSPPKVSLRGSCA